MGYQACQPHQAAVVNAVAALMSTYTHRQTPMSTESTVLNNDSQNDTSICTCISDALTPTEQIALTAITALLKDIDSSRHKEILSHLK